MSVGPRRRTIELCDALNKKNQEEQQKQEMERPNRIFTDLPFTRPEQIAEWVYNNEKNWVELEQLRSTNYATYESTIKFNKSPERVEQVRKCKDYLSRLENPPVYIPPEQIPPKNPEAEFWERMRAPLNPGSAQPALTQTKPREQVVQWVQGNRIIMRPQDREVIPGERMATTRLI